LSLSFKINPPFGPLFVHCKGGFISNGSWYVIAVDKYNMICVCSFQFYGQMDHTHFLLQRYNLFMFPTHSYHCNLSLLFFHFRYWPVQSWIKS